MARPGTNHEDSEHVDFLKLLSNAGLTDQEAADAASLHVNTVKKIVRRDHVHPNSRLKLYRALRHVIDAAVVVNAEPTKLRLQSAGEFSIGARKQAVLMQAESLSRAAFELAHGLTGQGASLARRDYEQICSYIELARLSLSRVAEVEPTQEG
jgi:hypothetical protein